MALTVPVAEIVENSKNPLLGKRESWGRVLLGDIATIQNGFPFKSSQFSKEKGIPLIRIRDVGADRTDTNYVGEYAYDYLVEPGDLLIGMDGDFNCARWRGPTGLLNQRVCRVILKSDIYHPKLLDYTLPAYLKAINDMTSSVTVKHLSSKSIAEIPLPLPPMDQQKRIVAEIEKQFSRLDEAVANLKRVKANLKRYKVAVLKAAVEGRLVETEAELARREGRSYETGAQLLQRILETRRSQWNGKGKYKEPAAPDTADLPELPEGWVWASLDHVTSKITSGSRDWSPFYGKGTSIFVLAQNVRPLVPDFSVQQLVDPPVDDPSCERSRIVDGDLLVTIVGANTGQVCLVSKTPGVAYVCQSVALMRPALTATAHYLNYWLNSDEHGQRYFEKCMYGQGRPHLSFEQLMATPVAFPSLAEQHQIVNDVERRFSLIRETEAQVDANIKRAQLLRQVILSNEFGTQRNGDYGGI